MPKRITLNMIIQYCSDLHLEFPENRDWLEKNPIKPIGDILLIGGDTFYLGDGFEDHRIFDYFSQNFKEVLLIPGNHEFYGGFDCAMCMELDFKHKIRDNVFMVNNTVKEFDDVQIILSTMWSRIKENGDPIKWYLNDFRLIKHNGNKLTVDDYNNLFDTSWAFLIDNIQQKSTKKNVVITHHLPSELCNLEKHKNSMLNEAFCTDLTDHIRDSEVDYWIYGHSHGNKKPFTIGKTTMLTNQMGYIQLNENGAFKTDAVIEL